MEGFPVIVLKIIGLVLAFVFLLLVLSLIIDAILRQWFNDTVEIVVVPGSNAEASDRTLFVYLPGLLSFAQASSVDLIDVWRRYGDVMLVEYNDTTFNGSVVARCVVTHLQRLQSDRPYNYVVFIGSSMGGLIAHDVIRQIEIDDSVLPELLLLDAPTSASDLWAVPSGAVRLMPVLLFLLPFGPIWNSLHLLRKLFVPPKEENIEPGVDRAELARRVGEAQESNMSLWRDQLRYIVTHGAPQPGSLTGRVNRLDYVRSIRDDDTVRPIAYKTWAKTVDFSQQWFVDSTHVGFAERPNIWRETFDQLLRELVRR